MEDKTKDKELIEKLISTINNNFLISQESQIIMRGESDWYKFSAQELEFLEKNGYDKKLLTKALVNHIIESLMLQDLLLLLKYISNDSYNSIKISEELKFYIEEYFNEKYLKAEDIEAIILANPNNTPAWTLVVKNTEDGEFTWSTAKRSEILKLQDIIKEKVVDLDKNMSKHMAQYVGFMSQFKR